MTQKMALSSEQGTRSEKTLKIEIDIQFPLMFATLRLSVIIAPSEAVFYRRYRYAISFAR